MESPAISWKRMGESALLFRFADKANTDALEWSLAFSAELERDPPAGVADCVPTVTSLLVEWAEPLFDAEGAASGILARLQSAPLRSVSDFPLHEIPVTYNGPDLDAVAQVHNLSPNQVAARHSEGEYRVFMLGFSPGFAYLGPLSKDLHTPRLPVPRSRVPAGSVAIGGEHTAIYPQASPGGWNLIGTTDIPLFQPSKNGIEAFRFKPGDRVRFVPI